MNIQVKTKFDIEQKAYILHENKINEVIVSSIITETKGTPPDGEQVTNILYTVTNNGTLLSDIFPENKLFLSQENLINAIKINEDAKE